MRFEVRDALLAFAYSRLAGLMSAAQRLTALGQREAQQILRRRLEEAPERCEEILRTIANPISCFAPRFDIRQMNHRYVYSRLFRS
jgi:urease accessory protein UreF